MTNEAIPTYPHDAPEHLQSTELRVDGWYTLVEVSFRAMLQTSEHDVVDIGFLAMDPDGFVFRMRLEVGGSFVGTDHRGWAERECSRLLAILQGEDPADDIFFHDADGSPAAAAGWVERDAPIVFDCPLEIPEDLVIVDDVASGRLVESIRGRFRTGSGYLSSSTLGRFLEHPIFMIPFTRRKAVEAARRRPWLLAATTEEKFEKFVMEAPDMAALSSPAYLSRNAWVFGRSWSEKSIACVDRFGPATKERSGRNVDADIVALLESLPVDWLPSDGDAFAVAAALSKLCDVGWTFGAADVRNLLSGLKGRWVAFAKSVSIDGGGSPLEI